MTSWNGQTFFGLSTETKPTTREQFAALGYSLYATGLVFVEIDTSKLYFFDAESATWMEWGA